MKVDKLVATALSTASPLARRATTLHRYDVLASRSTGYVNTVSVMPGDGARDLRVAVSVMDRSYTHGPGGVVTVALRHLNVGRRVRNDAG